MTKKHFISIADRIRDHNQRLDQFGDAFGEEHLNTLVEAFQDINPRFNALLWLDYIVGKCGPNGGKR